MKAYIRNFLQTSKTPIHGRNLVREYLQARALSSLQRMGAFVQLAFHGGTALRFLYGIPRFSEDLDFSLEGDHSSYDFRKYLHNIHKEFTLEGYAVAVKFNEKKVVHTAFVRFHGLLHELGLSPHDNEAIAVKLEVDTKPPKCVGLDTTIVMRHETLQLHHHDRASLLSGKLHALLQRQFTKGRDLYDLMWYLSNPDWPPPNLSFLNNALVQTGWDGEMLTAASWKSILLEKLRTLDWDRVAADVRPFLEKSEQVDLLGLENFSRLLL
jgi:hypothetical protein